MKTKLFYHFLLVFLTTLITNSPSFVYAQTDNYDIHKEIPLRFSYRAANTGGFEAASPWIWLGGVIESKLYFSKMNVPTAISVPAKLIMECQAGDIWPGYQAPCRAWIESQDDPDVPELWSNYGYTLGVKFRDIFTETELADVGKDFAMKIDEHGAMPLGDNRICGIDYLEYASFPASEFIPDTKAIQKVAKKIVGAAGIGTVRLVGELILEGNYVEMNIADATLKFYGFRNSAAYPDPANDPNVKTFALTVPSAKDIETSLIYNAESKTLFYEPLIQYSLNLYNSAGLEFSLIGPLHFNWLPKGENVMSYSCPDAATLHNRNYYNKAADDFKISSERPIVVSFPVKFPPQDPVFLPDIAITEVRFNGVPDGEVFADEWTTIDFTITNIGERGTVSSPEPLFTYSLFFNGQPAPDDPGGMADAVVPDPYDPFDTMLFRWIDDVPQDLYKTTLVSLPKNASHRVGSFVYKFPEGPLKVEISTGYNEYKTTQNGQPVYGIGDYHVANNYRIARQLYVQPKRGTVLGRIITNPCNGDCGVSGIQVCLKDTKPGGYYECKTTSTATGYDQGSYRFDNVPTGDYTLEYRPTPPTAAQIAAGTPYYAPRSFPFHHDGQDTDDFNYNTTRSGMEIFQYQTLKGIVQNQSGVPIQGVAVQLGIADVGPFGPAVTTDANGLFTFTRGLPSYNGNGELVSSAIPPTGDYTVSIRHDLYQPKEIQFHLGVVDSKQTETVVTNTYFDPEVNPNGSTSGPVKLTLDATVPVLTVHPLANEGYGSNTLDLQFFASDTNGKQVKQYRYTVYYGTSGTAHATPSEWFPYPVPDAANPDALVGVTANIGAPLAEGQHRLYVEVSDGRNVTGAYLNFTKDVGAPVISTVVFKDPVTSSVITATTSKQVDVTVTLANTESGPLKAWLSNDGLNWSGPFTFTGTTTIIRQWALTELETYRQTTPPHTVYVKVRDQAENESAVAQGSIYVDTSGAVRLADGAAYFRSSTVPLSIDISPPPGTLIFSETGAGTKINIGDTADTQYRAQTITLDAAKTFNFIELFMSYAQPPPVTGTPGPLKIKIVSQLPTADPSVSNSANASLVKAQWSFPANDVASLVKKFGHLPIALPTPLTLNAGVYYLLMYTDAVDANHYYSKATGIYSTYSTNPEAHQRFDFIPAQSAWVPQTGMSIYTLTYKFWDNQQGQIRIAANGNCGSLTEAAWIEYVFPATVPRFIDFSAIDTGSGAGLGPQTVCVEYKHPTINTKDGLYYDSVIVDTVAPTGTVTIDSVEKEAKTLYLNLSASADVEAFVWRFAGGPWSTIVESYRTSLRIPNLSVDTVEVKFIDKAGNESPVYSVTLPEDIFAPVLGSFTINDGTGFTTNPQLTFHLNATDNRSLAGIVYKETVTGAKGEIAATGTSYNPDPPPTIALPKVKAKLNADQTEVQDWLDGVYQFIVQARDAAGNRSMSRQATVTLDRKAPEIRNLYLKGFDGRALTTVSAFHLVLDCQDAFGPLQMRHSFDNATWTAWQTIEPREITLPIYAPTPMPANYTLYIQVKDGAGNTTSAQAGIKTNRPPATPVGGSPSGTAFTDSPRIAPSPFYDADGDTLEAVWFKVLKADDQTVVVNTMPLYGSTSYTLSSLDLFYNVGYTWSARYLDSFGQWSSWSDPVSFILQKPTLRVYKTGNGRIMSGGGQIDCGDDCSETYDPGYSPVLTATPDAGYVFAGWSGACAGTANCLVVMDADKVVTANFTTGIPKGDVNASGTVDLADAIAALQIQSGFYPAPVVLTADVNSDGRIGLPDAIYVLQMLSGLRAAALPELTIVKTGNGTGTVTSTPSGIACGADCSETYASGTPVTLTATPDASSTFTGWSGACTGATTCTVTMDTAKTVGASFALKIWTVTPSEGAGGTIAPAAVVTIEHGSGMTFTITPAEGYHVVDVLVDGGSVGAVTSYNFTNVTASHNIAASFAVNATTHTITATAGVYGTISPAGATTVNRGASQTYTITPQSSYHVMHVYIDDIEAGPVTSYTFSNVSAKHTIHAVFEADVPFTDSANLALTSWHLAGVTIGKFATAPYGLIDFDDKARMFDQSLTYPDNPSQRLIDGSIALDSLGIISGNNWILETETSLTISHGKMTESRDFMSFIGQSRSGSLELFTAMNGGIAFLLGGSADLSGTWHLFGFRAGDGAGPLKGSLTLDAAGEVSAASSLTFPDKTTLSVKGSLANGLDMTMDALQLNSGQITPGRTLMTWTDTGKSAHDFFLAVKDGGTFPQGFLEGTWYITGIDAVTTWQGLLTMTGEGTIARGILIDSGERPAEIAGGEIAMDAAGVIAKSTLTVVGGEPLGIVRGKMSTDKNMIAWIMKTPGGIPGFFILTKGRDQR